MENGIHPSIHPSIDGDAPHPSQPAGAQKWKKSQKIEFFMVPPELHSGSQEGENCHNNHFFDHQTATNRSQEVSGSPNRKVNVFVSGFSRLQKGAQKASNPRFGVSGYLLAAPGGVKIVKISKIKFFKVTSESLSGPQKSNNWRDHHFLDHQTVTRRRQVASGGPNHKADALVVACSCRLKGAQNASNP